MKNLESWDQVATLTEGLVMIAGWASGQDERGLTAESVVAVTDEYKVTFVVSETTEFLEFVTRLTIYSDRMFDKNRFESTIRLLTKICIEESLPQYLKGAERNSKDCVYELTYPWKCDGELQRELTLPVLHHTINRWYECMSMPALSIAPLLGLYLRGQFKRDEDFLSAVRGSLEMIAIATLGSA